MLTCLVRSYHIPVVAYQGSAEKELAIIFPVAKQGNKVM
jgi:hypothetical protein